MTSVDNNPHYQAGDQRSGGIVLKKKHIRQYRKDFAEASAFSPGMSVLELGCGNGLFLQYLKHIGVGDFVGVDGDSRIRRTIPSNVSDHLVIADIEVYLRDTVATRRFDRVVLFDVLEHFSIDDGIALLTAIGEILAPDGRVVIRVPNMASPFALPIYFGDITHRAGYTPASIAQAAHVANYETVLVQTPAYSSASKEIRERILTGLMGWFLAAPPPIWSANMIAVLRPRRPSAA